MLASGGGTVIDPLLANAEAVEGLTIERRMNLNVQECKLYIRESSSLLASGIPEIASAEQHVRMSSFVEVLRRSANVAQSKSWGRTDDLQKQKV